MTVPTPPPLDLEPLKLKILEEVKTQLEESNKQLLETVVGKIDSNENEIEQVKKVLGFIIDSGFKDEVEEEIKK